MSNRRRPANTRGTRPKGFRAALAAKTQRTDTYPLPIADSDTADAASAAYEKTRERVDYLETAFGADPVTEQGKEQLAAARKSRDAAREVLDACFWPVTLRSIPEKALDALINEHPPTAEQKERGATFNADTILCPLLAACVDDEENLTADEWAIELADDDRWTEPDRDELRAKVFAVQRRSFSDGIPNV